MKDKQRKKTKDSMKLFLFFCCLFIFIGGCEDNPDKLKNENRTDTSVEATIKPLPLIEDAEYSFERSYGWLDDETFIYSAVKDEQYYLFSYHLTSEKKHQLFKTNEIIAEASISPNKEMILVYSSRDYSSANLRMLSLDGEELCVVSILSSELSFTWNPFDEKVVLLNSFNEDWSFKTYLWYFNEDRIEEIHLIKPFAQWYSKDSLVYLDSSSTQQATTLVEYDIRTEEEKIVYEDVVAFRNEQTISLIIQNNQEEAPSFNYEFYDENGNKVQSLQMSLNKGYTEWGLLPFDILKKEHKFVTFVEEEKEQYQLTEFNLKTGNSKVLISVTEPAPILYSPNGKRFLYGYTLEKLIEI